MRAITDGDTIWCYADGVLQTTYVMTTNDKTLTPGTFAGIYGDGADRLKNFSADPAPFVSVAPDLSGQHRHLTQSQDGTGGAYLNGEGLSLPGVVDNKRRHRILWLCPSPAISRSR